MKETILVIAILGGYGIFLIAVAITIYYSMRIRNMLRTRFPLKYAELGQPTLIGGNSASKNKYSRFIRRREYLELNDKQLNHVIHLCRISNRVGMIGFLIFFVSLFSLFAHS